MNRGILFFVVLMYANHCIATATGIGDNFTDYTQTGPVPTIQTEISIDPESLAQLEAMNQNLEATNQTIQGMEGQFDQANNNWANTNESINGVTEQWEQTNDLIGTLTNPGNLFLLTASAGAGFVIGSAIAHLAITLIKKGLKALFSFLHEKVTKTKANQKLIEDFELAMKDYDATMKSARSLEKVIKQILILQKNLLDKNINYSKKVALNVLNNIISVKSVDYQFLKNEKKVLIMDKQYENAIKNKFARQKLKKEIKQLKQTAFLIEEDRHNNICESLNHFYFELIAIEGKLEDFRIDILAAKREWEKRYQKEKKEKSKRSNKIIKDARPIYKSKKKAAKKDAKRQIKELKSDKKTMFKACLNELGFNDESITKQEKIQLYSRKFDINPPNRFKTIFGGPRYYKIKICKEIISQKINYQVEKEKIIKSKEKKISMAKKSFLKTQGNAHNMRKRPEQSAEVEKAYDYIYFDRIADDQDLFNRQNHEKNSRSISRGYLLSHLLEEICHN